MRALTEEEIRMASDADSLREAIDSLFRKDSRTAAEEELLEALKDYRQKHYGYPSSAYYSSSDMFFLFD